MGGKNSSRKIVSRLYLLKHVVQFSGLSAFISGGGIYFRPQFRANSVIGGDKPAATSDGGGLPD
jgi:hypothetical protein